MLKYAINHHFMHTFLDTFLEVSGNSGGQERIYGEVPAGNVHNPPLRMSLPGGFWTQTNVKYNGSGSWLARECAQTGMF